MVYLRGIGRRFVKPDPAEAKKWLTAAAEQGFAQAQYDLATLYFDAGDAETGMHWLQRAVAQEQTEALTMLSHRYRDGDGFAADAARSAELLRRAAALGDPVAQTELGVALREGEGMARNASESVAWFEKAAIQGYTESQYNLGLAYARGTGVDPDPVRGVAWLEICVEERHREAIRAVSPVRRQLSPDQREAAAELREQLMARLPEQPAPVVRRW
jgi:TPR repeat protein